MEGTDTSLLSPSGPPHQLEPPPKKLKMPSISGEEAATPNGAARKQKYKRRKIAIFFGYCGVGYQGMQKNPGAKTIEGELEEALFHAGAVHDQDRGRPNRYDWSRSARTDKGVSAVGQVVSGRFYLDPPGLDERLNSILPAQIQIFGHKLVTGSFSSQKLCDRRRYVYLIPVFALDPTRHRGEQSPMASFGSNTELVKCLDCSERWLKTVAVMGKSSFDVKTSGDSKGCCDSILNSESEVNSGVLLNEECIVKTEVNNMNDSDSVPIKESKITPDTVDCESLDVTEASVQNEGGELNCKSLDSPMLAPEEVKANKEKSAKQSQFLYGEKERERFNRILNKYVGSHNFHNFTTRTKAEDPAARRYIISFEASNTVTVNGIDFVKCEVTGQSFMLHQIRKMMGLAVAVMRGCAPESLMESALQKDVNIKVPTAPEVGLYLDECIFSSYNKKWKDTHEEISMKDYAEEAEDFKIKHIYTHIAETEHKDGVIALWLHSLNHQNYPDSGFACRNRAIIDSKSDKVEKITEDGRAEQLVNITVDGKSDEEDNKIMEQIVLPTEQKIV